MIDGTRFALFVSAAAILALTPGPGILFVLGRTLHGGRREGVLSALGTLVSGAQSTSWLQDWDSPRS